jgi:hypothetical protein
MGSFRRDLLVEALLRPKAMASLALAEWDRLLPRARVAELLPRLAIAAQREGIVDRLPEPVVRHLSTGLALAGAQRRAVEWELHCLERELAPLGAPVMLLKGAAYVAARLPMAEGRLFGDVDIMVPEADLERAQSILLDAGWTFGESEEYDRRYYLRWMHELPPLRHAGRGSVLDVHHAILPRTSRLKPQSARLWAQARRLAGSSFVAPCPADMLLHSAAHLFHDGDMDLMLRDLLDIHDMAELFGREPELWPDLIDRAEELDLARPLFYAMRYRERILGAGPPAAVATRLGGRGPGRLARAVMDRAVPPVLLPPTPDQSRLRRPAALFLYVRSHWLRMPPLLLASHLARKSLRRLRMAEPEGEQAR